MEVELNDTSARRLVRLLGGKAAAAAAAAALELVRTHGEAGSGPFAGPRGIMGAGIGVRLVGFLLRYGAQSAYPTEQLARHLSGCVVHH